ncbi:Gfo/Idh/MocA family oxidoreductase [uncultured Maritimibacter sp.]|uniref:Gfo/Idh/MocA family protein n=1 Tax=uncultured Maritimibacter sp. TaxID=991866 RepID=UPI000B256F24|nr:Gfo/Idh/MocA family oxidoreductase [uncultured Maritimibacter sp.]
MTRTDIAIVGLGKIARDQHLPAIEAGGRFRLAATVSRSGGMDGVQNYESVEALISARPDIGVVSFCTPPQVRYGAARAALEAGRHVMLEKPPGASVAEVRDLAALAELQGLTLFATWHSRMAAGVDGAKAWLSDKAVRAVRIDWKEDVRVWHPGQAWIWQAGGLGVFDPGINALSILTEILPGAVHVSEADLHVPTNCETPIAADLRLAGPGGMAGEVALDWLAEGAPTWTIRVRTHAGELTLEKGGSVLTIDGAGAGEDAAELQGEYPRLYARMAELIDGGTSDVDLRPLELVADAFLLGRRTKAAPYHDPVETGER